MPPGGTKKSPEQPSFRTLMAFGEKDLNRGWKANALLKAVKTVQKPPAVVKGPVLDGGRERFQQKLKLHKEWNESLFSALLKRKKSDTSDWTEEPLTVKTISQYDDFLGLYEVQTSRGCLYFCRHDSSEWKKSLKCLQRASKTDASIQVTLIQEKFIFHAAPPKRAKKGGQ